MYSRKKANLNSLPALQTIGPYQSRGCGVAQYVCWCTSKCPDGLFIRVKGFQNPAKKTLSHANQPTCACELLSNSRSSRLEPNMPACKHCSLPGPTCCTTKRDHMPVKKGQQGLRRTCQNSQAPGKQRERPNHCLKQCTNAPKKIRANKPKTV